MAEAVEMLYYLYGALAGECQLEDKQFAVLDPLVPVLICGIVRELNGRSRGASAAEWITPDPPRASGASLSRGALCGCGRDYRRCCGAH